MVQLINITTEKLGEIISESIEKKLKESKEEYKPQPAQSYITRIEASKMLNVSFVTLRSWHIKKVLISYSIGNRVYYKLDDIHNAMKPNFYD